MILVLGGTTEGKLVANMLDVIGEAYFYSTKNKVRQQVKGKMISGALNYTRMLTLCKTEKLKLLIDAAHPFALELHQTVSAVAHALNIPCIRYERQYPDLVEGKYLRFFNSFSEKRILPA